MHAHNTTCASHSGQPCDCGFIISVPALSVAAGSLPASSVDALIEKWSNDAHRCNQRAEAMTRNGGFGARELSNVEVENQRIYRLCAAALRAEMDRVNKRQPEENHE